MDIAACTLSEAGRLARAAEFGQLFTETVRAVERPDPTWLRIDLEPGTVPAGRTAELMAAETQCCSFFVFTLTASAGSLVLDIRVPGAHADVLDGLAARAAAAR
jgi:hypothetical protein